MNLAPDLFAETNPAFCTTALTAFTRSYVHLQPDGPEMALTYLALPLALSGDLAGTFSGTNKNTGLIEWVNRSPEIQIALPDRINASMPFVTAAIRYACFFRLLLLDEDTRLQVGPNRIRPAAVQRLGPEASRSIRHASQLGFWFASAGTSRTVFATLDVTV